MNDRDVIQSAYEESLKEVYAAFASAFTSACGDAQKESEADAQFQRGVVHVRHLRDRALALLPAPPVASESREAFPGPPARPRPKKKAPSAKTSASEP